MAFTTTGGNLALAFMFTTDAVTRPTAWWVGLHYGDPGADGTANEVTNVMDTSYVRKSITFATPSAKQTISTLQVSWTAGTVATPFDITHVSVFPAETGGSSLVSAAKPVIVNVTTGKVTTFDVGEVIANAL